MPVIRKLLSPSQLYNPHLSYDVENNLVLYDGEPSPQFDPRSQNPPIPDTFEDKRCASAATVVALMRAAVEQIIANITAGRDATFIVSAFLALMAVLGWIAIFVALIAALVGAALAAGAEALETAFTNETWDTLTCIIYCHTNNDGWIDTDSIPVIKADVAAQLPTLAAVIINYYLDVFGTGGLASAYIVLNGLVEGDCVECACTWCWTWTEAELYAEESWTLHHSVVGEYVITYFDIGVTTQIYGAEFTYAISGEGSLVDGGVAIIRQDFPTNPALAGGTVSNPGGTVTYTGDSNIPVDVTYLQCYVSNDWSIGADYPVITGITLYGVGSVPAFSNGTEC